MYGSSNHVKEAPNPKPTKCTVVQLPNLKKWDKTYFRYRFFLPDDQLLNVSATFQKCKNNQVVKFLAF